MAPKLILKPLDAPPGIRAHEVVAVWHTAQDRSQAVILDRVAPNEAALVSELGRIALARRTAVLRKTAAAMEFASLSRQPDVSDRAVRMDAAVLANLEAWAEMRRLDERTVELVREFANSCLDGAEKRD